MITRKWLAPSVEPACPTCWWDSSMTSRWEGCRASRRLEMSSRRCCESGAGGSADDDKGLVLFEGRILARGVSVGDVSAQPQGLCNDKGNEQDHQAEHLEIDPLGFGIVPGE